MTDETKRDVKKSNKIKIWIKHSIWDKISPSFASVWRFLKQKIKLIFQFSPNSKNVCGFSHFTSGYVQILAVVCIPVLLFGAKYLLDYRTLSDRNVTQGIGKRLVKQCAVNAALNVAQKWNPALTYAKQKTAMLRIADEIYNTSKAYLDSPLVQAAHGINMKKKVMTSGGTYDPFNSTASTESLQTEFDPKKKQIVPKTEKTNECRYYFYYHYETNHAPMATQHFDIMYNSLKQTNSNLFPPDEDLYQDYTYYCYCDNIDDPSGAGVKWFHYVTWPEVVGMYKSDGTPKKVETKSYTTRANPNDETVKIEIEDDKIKVTTDDDVAYAVPAECNVDIILTVPTNSAALNPD
nr:hypothetical protein [Alphaproteobacteria bacterium]